MNKAIGKRLEQLPIWVGAKVREGMFKKEILLLKSTEIDCIRYCVLKYYNLSIRY